MKHISILLALILTTILTTGCSTLKQTQIRVGALHDMNKSIDGDNPMAYLEITVPVTETVTCGYTHISHFTSGVPFNNRSEQNADTLGCYWRIW